MKDIIKFLEFIKESADSDRMSIENQEKQIVSECIRRGYDYILEILIKDDINPDIEFVENGGYVNSVICAVSNNDYKILEMLLDSGAKIDTFKPFVNSIVPDPNQHCPSIFYYASTIGMLWYILDNDANPTLEDNKGFNLFDYYGESFKPKIGAGYRVFRPKILKELKSEKFVNWFVKKYPQKATELRKIFDEEEYQKIKDKYSNIFKTSDLGLF